MKPEEQAEKTYADILLLPYPKPKRPTYLSLRERAAQFAPFAALAGYEEMVQEEARLTEPEKELSEWELQLLDGTLHQMEEQMKAALGTKVHVNRKNSKAGRIEIEYYSVEELERIYDLIRSCS